MNYRRIIAAFASMLIMAGSAVSCGKDEETNKANTNENISVSEKSDSVSTTEEETAEDAEEAAAVTTVSAKKDKKSDSESTTTAAAETETSGTDTGTGGSKSTVTATTSKSAGNTSSGSTAVSSTGNTASESSGIVSSSGNASSGNNIAVSDGGNTSADSGNENYDNQNNDVQEENPEENPDEPNEEPAVESLYTAEITLGDNPEISGENVSANGSVVYITAGGDYMINGSVGNGQIFVETAAEEKVKIILNGVNISNQSGPAILVNDAKKCTIELADGTESWLSDGGNDKVYDGVIFSNDTLRIKGSGILNINSGNAHGIASDDDIIIEDGTYNINSVKSGLFAHDDITINGGTLNINGGTNGIKSKGTVNINGGYTVVSGGTKEEKSSVYAASAFNYTGGYLFAAGNKVTAPTTAANPYIVADIGETVGGGTSVSMILNGTQMISFSPQNNFRVIMMLCPEISNGSAFAAEINGVKYEGFTVENVQNVFTLK